MGKSQADVASKVISISSEYTKPEESDGGEDDSTPSDDPDNG